MQQRGWWLAGGSWEEGRWRQSSGRDAEGHGKQAWCSAHTGKATAPTLEVTRDTRAQVKPRRAHTHEKILSTGYTPIKETENTRLWRLVHSGL